MHSIVDMHAHYVSPDLIREAERNGASYGVTLRYNEAGDAQIAFGDGPWLRPFLPRLRDLDHRRDGLTAQGVDLQIQSAWTDIAGDSLEPALAARWARLQNETMAADVAAAGPMFAAMGTLPMQDPAQAIVEVDYLVGRLAIHAVEIGTNIRGRDLDHPEFRPLWRRLRDLDVFVLLHPPLRPVGLDRTGDYFLNNLISYPADTTIAAARLLFGNLFEELPGLKICLAHGGGFLPYQIGRLDRGHEAHPACKTLSKPPSLFLDHFIFDSLTHDTQALAYLITRAGADRVVYGSDYPFEMLDERGPDRLGEIATLTRAQKEAILGANMRGFLARPRARELSSRADRPL
jgi:aminocarboxymuconate-semialdehyde decarboxylase